MLLHEHVTLERYHHTERQASSTEGRRYDDLMEYGPPVTAIPFTSVDPFLELRNVIVGTYTTDYSLHGSTSFNLIL